MSQHRALLSTAVDSLEYESGYTVQTVQDKFKRKIYLRKLLICICVFSLIFVIAAAIVVGFLYGATDLFKSDRSSPTAGPSNGMENSKIFEYIDTSYDPCEDFYKYSCGRWSGTSPPSYAAKWGPFEDLELDNYNKLAEYLSQPVSTDDSEAIKKAKYIYSACTDTDCIVENYVNQLDSFMIKAGGWNNGDFYPYDSWSINDTLNNLYKDHYFGSSAFFTFRISPDDLNSSKQVIKVRPSLVAILLATCPIATCAAKTEVVIIDYLLCQCSGVARLP